MKGTMTGNKVLFKIGGTPVGAGVQSVNVSDDLGLQDVDGLGDPESAEFVPGKVTHTIQVSRYFLSSKKLRDLGYVPTSDQYLNPIEFEIEVIDRATGTTSELYTGCQAARHERSYGKHVVSGENATFRALHKAA